MIKEHILKQCIKLQVKLSNKAGTESDIDGAELYNKICILLQGMLISELKCNVELVIKK